MVLSTLLQNRMVLFPISEPRSPLPFPSELRGFSLFLLQNHMALFLFPQNLMVLPFTSEPRGLLFTSEPHGLLSLYFGAAWSPLLYGCQA